MSLEDKREHRDNYDRQEPIADIYDLFYKAIKVHSPIPEITADFTLSDLKEDSAKNKSISFVRDQIKVCKVITNFIGSYNKEEVRNINSTLMGDVYVTVIMSRASGGRIIDRLLRFGEAKDDSDEEEKKGIIERIRNFRKDDKKGDDLSG